MDIDVRALYPLAEHAVLVNANAVDARLVLLKIGHDFDVVAVLDIQPYGYVKVRLLYECNALPCYAALNLKGHLERRSTRV